jgi:MFS family permease
VLILAALTNTFVVALPTMCLPVLFAEISTELNLDLVQIGLIWGLNSLPGIFMSLASGVIGDRFEPKWIIALGCVLLGLSGASRGLAQDFPALMLTVLLLGFLTPLITINVLKTCSIWFPPNQLGLANGILSMGMALGFIIGSFLSASVLSPWLGGWRNVLLFLGAISSVVCLPWIFARVHPGVHLRKAAATAGNSIWASLRVVARIRRIWLLSLIGLCVAGAIQGLLGYLPLYLRDLGWSANTSDLAQTSFHLMSIAFVIPITLWSDRIRKREWILIASATMIATGIGLLSVADGLIVWLAIALAGMVRDGFMGVFLTSVLETEGVGVTYSGTAVGLVLACVFFGNLIAPPIGNSLAEISPNLPFVFWAGLALTGLAGLIALTRSIQLRRAAVQE